MIEPLETREGEPAGGAGNSAMIPPDPVKRNGSPFPWRDQKDSGRKGKFFENWKVCNPVYDSFIQEKVMIHSAKEWKRTGNSW